MTARASFRALGTGAVVCVTDPATLAVARGAVERELAAIDAACSRFRADSELTRLNAAAGSWTPVGALLLEAVRVALRAAEASGGLVDPTIARTLRASGYDRTFELVRARDRGPARFERVAGWRTVELDEHRSAVRLAPGSELDLGATAKALAADRAAEAAASASACGALVSLGGDVAVAGPPPPDGWPVALADDHASPLAAGPSVSIASGGLASSSTAVRRWRAGGAELHHVVDPRTGRPAASPWRTITVAAASCVDANTASTAAIVLGEDAPAWLEARRLPARLVAASGSTRCLAGWPQEPA